MSTDGPIEGPWLNQPQLEAWIALNALLEVVPTAIEGQLKHDTGVNLFEYTLLAMLSEQDDHTLVMRDLAGLAMGSLSRLSHAITRLENRGWVARQAGVGGRRHNTVGLTSDGAAAIADAAPLHVANVRRLLVEPLSEEELAALTTVAAKLVAAADAEAGCRLAALTPEIVARNLGQS